MKDRANRYLRSLAIATAAALAAAGGQLQSLSGSFAQGEYSSTR